MKNEKDSIENIIEREAKKSERLNNFALGFSIFTLLVVIVVEVIVK